jgi:hypothetical protein
MFVPMARFASILFSLVVRRHGVGIPLGEGAPEVAFLAPHLLVRNPQPKSGDIVILRGRADQSGGPGPRVFVMAGETGPVPRNMVGGLVTVFTFFPQRAAERHPTFPNRLQRSIRHRVAFLTIHPGVSVAQGIKFVVVEQRRRPPGLLGMATGAIGGGASSVGIFVAIGTHLA